MAVREMQAYILLQLQLDTALRHCAGTTIFQEGLVLKGIKALKG